MSENKETEKQSVAMWRSLIRAQRRALAAAREVCENADIERLAKLHWALSQLAETEKDIYFELVGGGTSMDIVATLAAAHPAAPRGAA